MHIKETYFKPVWVALVEKINIFNKQAEERNGVFKLKKKKKKSWTIAQIHR